MCIEKAKGSHFTDLSLLLIFSPRIYDPKLSNLQIGYSGDSKVALFAKEPHENSCVIKRRPNREPGNSREQET